MTTSAPGQQADGGSKDPADKSSEPIDDLVTSRHSITLDDGGELSYSVTTGRIVLRQEGHTDDKFDGPQPKAEVFVTAYTADSEDPRARPVTFAFNGGPGSSSVWLHLGLLGPRRVVMGDVGNLLPPPYALADNSRDPAAPQRPGVHRPGLDRLLARGQGREVQGVPRLRRRHRVGRRGDPAVDHAQRAVDVAEVPLRRVLRHDQGRRPRPPPAAAIRAVPERPDADLRGAGLRHGRVRRRQRRPVRALPADLRRRRALSRQARRPAAARRARRRRRPTPSATTCGRSAAAPG